jgi:hypothetical protein
VEEKSEILKLLEECVKPSKPDGRIEVKDDVLQILRGLARQMM